MSEAGYFTQMALRYQRQRASRTPGPVRLYETVARMLVQDMRDGLYAIGDRLPAERELAARHQVNRAAVREALLALEVFGLVEVRIGSGAYVTALPDDIDSPAFTVSAAELIEARLLIECEAAAKAASNITPAELDALDHFIDLMADPVLINTPGHRPDAGFHLMIARASRNKALELSVRQLWDLRSASPYCRQMDERARAGNYPPLLGEHRAIVQALRSGDADAARQAMHAHLTATLHHLATAAAS